MLGLPRSNGIAGLGFNVRHVVRFCDTDFEPLEQAPRLGGLGACIPNEHFRSDAHVLEPLEQGCMQGEGQKPCGCLKAPEWPKTALMAPLPGALELGARSLPFVKLPLTNLPPAL